MPSKNNGHCEPEEGKEDVLGESVTSRLLNVSFHILSNAAILVFVNMSSVSSKYKHMHVAQLGFVKRKRLEVDDFGCRIIQKIKASQVLVIAQLNGV